MQAILAQEASIRTSATLTRHSPPVLLRGLLFAPNGERMLPTGTRKKAADGKKYLYYISSSDKKFVRGTNPIGSIPAKAIESMVVEQLLAALQSPQMVQSVWDEVRRQDSGINEPAVVVATLRPAASLMRIC